MEKDAIIRKINALMQVTVEHGATVDEALTAASMAQKLMAKYHIDSINLADEKEKVDEDSLDASRKWIQLLASIVGHNMCCQVIISTVNRKALLKVIGRESDRKIALDTINMLVTVCQQGIKREKARAKSQFGEAAGVELAYASGFIQAVREEMSKQCKALMLVIPDDVNKHVKEHYPRLAQTTIRNNINYRNAENISTARSNGYIDGKNLVSHRQLNSGK